MKRKAMYMKPLMEVVRVEEEAPLTAPSTTGPGHAGDSDNDGDWDDPGYNGGKSSFWYEEENKGKKDKGESDNLFSGRSPWDGFYKE